MSTREDFTPERMPRTIDQVCPYKGNTWKLSFADAPDELVFLHVSVVQHCQLQAGMTLTAAQWTRVRRLETFRKAYQHACYLLDQRGYSYQGLFRKLTPKYEEAVCYAVVNRLVKNGLLNDWRYAEQAAHYYVETKKFGFRRAYQAMRAKGLLDEQIRAALAPYADRMTEILQTLVTGRFAPYFADPADRKQVEKGKAALVRRGYGFSEIQQALVAAHDEEK